MADLAQLAFQDAKGGMNACDPPHKIEVNQVARMTNCAVIDGFPTTRFGLRVVPLSGPDRQFIGAANIQGASFYNPAKGQGGIQFSPSNPCIATAVGGRKYLVRLQGQKTRPLAVPQDITAGLFTRAQNHLVWLSQWEDLLVMADGESKTMIFNPTTGTRFSKGYNQKEKLQSEIPNGCTVLAYAHGRGVAVSLSRNILVGDSLHRVDLSSSSNLVQFTEQVYWATGQYFLPPSSMGGINAAAILPLKNTQHGHGDLLFHCEDGIFSLDLNQFPRSNWPNLQLVKHALLQSGATGPYAVALTDGDQCFRSRKGAMSFRSAAAAPDRIEGDPDLSLSAEVDTWLDADYPRWLRFASVCIWDKTWRSFYSTAPIVQGRFRWHRGMVVRNGDTVRTSKQDKPIWEGLWTFPLEMCGIIQLVNGLFDCEDRQFAWTRGVDNVNRLVEICSWLRSDVLEDGTERAIRSQVITRAVDAGEWWKTREFKSAKLFLRNAQGTVQWGVWFRSAESPVWRRWSAGSITVTPAEDKFDLTFSEGRSYAIPLEDIPTDCQDTGTKANESRSIQFLIRWEGYCQFEGIRVTHGANDVSGDKVEKENFSIVSKKPKGNDYSDFEYSLTTEANWITAKNE